MGLLCQLVPALEMTYVLRELFNIPGGLGRILNIVESMTYRYDQEEKSWTYWLNFIYYYFRHFETWLFLREKMDICWQCLFSDETVNIMSFSRFLHLKFSFNASLFFLQILLHFSLKKNLLLHPFWTPFHNIFSIQQLCGIIKLKTEQCESALEYYTYIICRRHLGYWNTRIAHFTKKSLLNPMICRNIESKMLIL